jgi:hypothetical protein
MTLTDSITNVREYDSPYPAAYGRLSHYVSMAEFSATRLIAAIRDGADPATLARLANVLEERTAKCDRNGIVEAVRAEKKAEFWAECERLVTAAYFGLEVDELDLDYARYALANREEDDDEF